MYTYSMYMLCMYDVLQRNESGAGEMGRDACWGCTESETAALAGNCVRFGAAWQ